MEKKIITFSAQEQDLKKTDGETSFATNTVSYIDAVFELGDNWDSFDSVRAIWQTTDKTMPSVLDASGQCAVPHEIVNTTGYVKVNLVGSVADGDTLVERLTTFPIIAFVLTADAKVDGDASTPITPSQFEQFVASVRSDADRAEAGASASEQSAGNSLASAQASEASAIRSANSATDSASSATASAESAQNASESAQSAENYAQDAEDARNEIRSMSANATTLPAGSDATASYSNGVLSLGIPKGDKGNKGDTGASAGFGTVSASVDATVGTPSVEVTTSGSDTAKNFAFAFHNLKGEQGEKGEQGDVNLGQIAELLPTETASGDIVSITDGQAIIPMESLKVALEPIQSGSGTPSPDNVRPISGWDEVNTHRTGKNLAEMISDGMTPSISSGLLVSYPQSTHSQYIKVNPSEAYTASFGNTLLNAVFQYDADKKFIRVDLPSTALKTVTTASTTAYIILRCDRDRNTDPISNCQLELGSTATAYEPYQGETYTNTLPETVYGGTLDVVSGELVIDRAMADLGSLNWTWNATNGWIARISGLKPMANNNAPMSAIASNMPVVSKVQSEAIMRSGTNEDTISATWQGTYLYGTNANASPTGQLAYELATPRTIQLTPQEVQMLLGANIVWSDGIVTIVYDADIQRWVAKERASTQAETDGMIAPTETAYKATRNYTSGSLLIVNGTLYKATANIQSGGTITPNTNVTATTLSEVISALA